jgi:hypothetical protein
MTTPLGCILCGRTDDDACLNETGETCAWVELAPGVLILDQGERAGGGLCSFCAAQLERSTSEDQAYVAGLIREGLSSQSFEAWKAAQPMVELVTEAQANAYLRTRVAGA